MNPLILHPTSTAQWQALVLEAEKKSSINLSEELESYLVFLLMRFIKNPEIIQSILAVDFLQSLEQVKHERELELRNVGDKCLLFSGFFPGRARRCRVNISYFVHLGQAAYSVLAEQTSSQSPDLFANLCQEFVGLMDILQTIAVLKHDNNGESSFLDLLQAEELWIDAKGQKAYQILRSHTDGFLLPKEFQHQNPLTKH